MFFIKHKASACGDITAVLIGRSEQFDGDGLYVKCFVIVCEVGVACPLFLNSDLCTLNVGDIRFYLGVGIGDIVECGIALVGACFDEVVVPSAAVICVGQVTAGICQCRVECYLFFDNCVLTAVKCSERFACLLGAGLYKLYLYRFV